MESAAMFEHFSQAKIVDDIPQRIEPGAGELVWYYVTQIDNKTRNIFKSFCRHFFTSLFLLTYEATYIAGYLLPTDDRYREHHDHIWIVLQFVE